MKLQKDVMSFHPFSTTVKITRVQRMLSDLVYMYVDSQCGLQVIVLSNNIPMST